MKIYPLFLNFWDCYYENLSLNKISLIFKLAKSNVSLCNLGHCNAARQGHKMLFIKRSGTLNYTKAQRDLRKVQ